MILNPFEIKAEVLSIIEDCKDETNPIVLNQRVAVLDKQTDLQSIEKVLFKELLHADTSKEKIIRFLLQRYVQKDRLITQLWSVLKNNMTSSEVKIIVLSYLRELETDWRYEDFDSSLGDIDIVDNDTKKLLENAIVNPEVQIDFLDFLASVNDKDKVLLVKSLGEDYSNDALANILIPIFFSAPETELGKTALDLLGTTRSQLAYHALNTAYESVSESLKPQVKKNINILKLAGVREDNSKEFYKKLLSESVPYRCCATYPDGHGNQALIFSRKNIKTNKVQFVAIVINDYTGIRDCFGFNEISEFECDKIIERFYKDEKNLPISPQVLKTLINYGENISKQNSSGWLLPYEYVCWKNIMVDIDSDSSDILTTLSSSVKSKKISDDEFKQLINSEFMEHWFLDAHYSSEFEAFIEIFNTEVQLENPNIDILISDYVNKVFYKEEADVWRKRLLISSYLELNTGNKSLSDIIYRLYCDNDGYNKFLSVILKKSLYEYYFSLKFNTEENQNKFTLNQLDDIIKLIEDKWVNYV